MDFGIFNLMQHRHTATPAQSIIQDAVRLAQVADDLGLAGVWTAEHHFSNYSLCPSPLVMAAHLAGVTKRIRVGTAVLIASLYQPARVLAEIGFVDNLSNGRLDVGLGSGYQPFEFERFGADLSKSKEHIVELLDMIELGLGRPHFSYQGRHHTQPDTAISAQPVQKPRPPVWVATSDAAITRRALQADHAVFISGVLGGSRRLGGLRQVIDDEAMKLGKDPRTRKVGLLRFVFASESKREVEHYAECARYQQRIAISLRSRTERLTDNYMVEEQPFADELPFERILANLPVGDPETCAERLVRDIRAARPDHIAMYCQVGDMERAVCERSLELFQTKVLPLLERELRRSD
jgi:alkanesulfonate monooxygenase SsuD/methylene tetrahydromethanopterin reductase-like flavin-dependent oxidoreductase (luciferase family)